MVMGWVQTLLVGTSATLAVAAVAHYPPQQTNINNLTFALHGSGRPGIFDSSFTPNNLYGIYNWCNMPHVRSREYKTPPREFVLESVEVIQRHHKRTPYNTNTFFKEDVSWDCRQSGPIYGLLSTKTPTTDIEWQAFSTSVNPFALAVGPGFVGSTCQFPQITDEGLADSYVHGQDLRSVYGHRLGLSESYDPSEAQIRVTNNQITSQVATGLAKGLFPRSAHVPVQIQHPAFDSLEPAYSCPKANSIRADYTTGPSGQAWKDHLTASQFLYDKLDKVSGIAKQDTAGWHSSFDHYYDNMSAKQCHGKRLPCSVNDTSVCVTQEEADTVYRLGQWEYSNQFRDAPNSTAYAALKYGAYMLELKARLQAKMQGHSKLKYQHNVAHDGSIAPLLGFLQIDNMVWPGMGSEVVFELYRRGSRYFVRVLWSGQPMKTSTPLGVLDMVKVEDFIGYIELMVGDGKQLLQACTQQ